MKKTILTLAFVASLSFTACSTDDSALTNDATANQLSTSTTIGTIDNGDKDLPKPPIKN